MNFTVRNMRIPEDYNQVAAILNVVLAEETNAKILAEEDSKIPSASCLQIDEKGLLTGFDRCRIVAEDLDNQVVGYGIAWRAPWTAAGELNHMLAVRPDCRKQGIGRSLYARLEAWALSVGAAKLNYEVRDNEEKAIAFAQQNGFTTERHTFESVLDLSSFDCGLLGAENGKIHITSLADIDDPDKELKLYELYKATSVDIPGFNGEFFDFHEWRNWTLKLPGSKPEYTLLALNDTGEFIGVAHVLLQQASRSMYHEYTGVHQDYRNRGIGLALKLKSIELALGLGLSYMRTHNDSLNVPMLKINRDRLQFKAVPGKYKVVKQLVKEGIQDASND